MGTPGDHKSSMFIPRAQRKWRTVDHVVVTSECGACDWLSNVVSLCRVGHCYFMLGSCTACPINRMVLSMDRGNRTYSPVSGVLCSLYACRDDRSY